MMDPATLTLALSLASQGMRMWADFSDRAAKGQMTDADLALLETAVQDHAAVFQAVVNAKKP